MGSLESAPSSTGRRTLRGEKPGDSPEASVPESELAMEVLLRAVPQANLHATDSEGMTPLHYAAKYLKTKQAKMLIDAAKMLIDAAKSRGDTAGLRGECHGKSAYRMAWEAAKDGKQDVCEIADLLENYVHADEQRASKKATRRFFKRFKIP